MFSQWHLVILVKTESVSSKVFFFSPPGKVQIMTHQIQAFCHFFEGSQKGRKAHFLSLCEGTFPFISLTRTTYWALQKTHQKEPLTLVRGHSVSVQECLNGGCLLIGPKASLIRWRPWTLSTLPHGPVRELWSKWGNSHIPHIASGHMSRILGQRQRQRSDFSGKIPHTGLWTSHSRVLARPQHPLRSPFQSSCEVRNNPIQIEFRVRPHQCCQHFQDSLRMLSGWLLVLLSAEVDGYRLEKISHQVRLLTDMMISWNDPSKVKFYKIGNQLSTISPTSPSP